MEQKITSIVETITPEIAREYLKFNVTNRPLRQKTVCKYAKQMKNGEFMLNGEAIVFSDGGSLLNGQHRLNACVQAGVSFQSVVVRGIPFETFHTIDIGKPRTTADVFSISGVSNPSNSATIVSHYMRLERSFGALNSGTSFDRMGVTRNDVLKTYEGARDVFDEVKTSASRMYSKSRLLKISTIGSVMSFLVLKRNHPIEKVEQFFYMLHYGKDVCNDSVNRLRDKLINNFSATRKMTDKYKMALIVKTWNAFISGKELKTLVWNEGKEGMPEFI